MLKLENTAYVLVSRNQLRVRHVESQREEVFTAQPAFSTTRLLIGNFAAADALMKRAFKQVVKRGFFSFSFPPQVVMHPLEMIEGGLAEVEERILVEIARGAGAPKAVVWVGAKLSDAEVVEKLRAAR